MDYGSGCHGAPVGTETKDHRKTLTKEHHTSKVHLTSDPYSGNKPYPYSTNYEHIMGIPVESDRGTRGLLLPVLDCYGPLDVI